MTLRIDAIAHGGDGIGRRSGKAVFVPGAFPGDVVDVETVEDRGRFERARLLRLVTPSPDRIDPPCRHATACGGCPWQPASLEAQHRWKRDLVVGQLAHIARLEVDVQPVAMPGPPFGYRNRMDFSTFRGKPALMGAGSHHLVELDECLLLAPPLVEVFRRLTDVSGRVTLRAGIATGDVVAVVGDRSVDSLRRAGVPAAPPRQARIAEVVAGVRFRISGRAFFQVNTAGAGGLVDLAERAGGVTSEDVVLDAYAGGGLFAATVGARARRVIAVESDPVALSDLRANTGANVDVVPGRVGEALATIEGSVDVVLVDPPRAGMGRTVVDLLVGLAPRTIVSISCDPASHARDARLLVDGGYELEWVVPVDLFPQTAHIETVSRFVRA